MMPESYRTAANGRQYNVCRSGFLPRQSRLLHPSAPTASPHQAQPLQFLSASGEPELSPQVRTMLEDEDGLSERGLSSSRRRYDDEEDYHSIYIGVPVPRGYRRKRRRRRSASSRDRTSESERHYERQERSDTDDGGHGCYESGNDNASRTMSPAAERLRYILGDDDEPPNPTLFTEMDTLQHDGEEMEWKESARWIKFEEKVEEGGERWSKPHVSTLSLHSLFELRTCLQTGTVLLDLDGYSLPQIIDDVIEKQIEDGLLKPELREKISYVLLRKHRHQTKKPIHRSLADIGKSVSSNTSRSPVRSPAAGAAFHRSTEDLRMRQSASYGRLRHVQSRSMNDISDTPSTDQLKNKFIKKIPKDAEASNVLVGEVEFLEKPFVAFVRLLQATMLGGVTEVPVPTRFLFILLGPAGKAKSYNEIGRAIATLMVDDLFSDVAYKARDREDLIAGIDEFLDEVIVLPPGEWDPNIRIEPPKKVPSAEKRKSVFSLNEVGQMNGTAGGAGAGSGGGGSDDGEMPEVHEIGEELAWTGRFCGGLYLDIKRKLPWFPSDFYEGFHIQSISAILFIYLGCITNAITFGGLLGDATDNYQGVMESFLGTAMAGSMFCLFAGQPLIILSSTGPILIFEKLLFDFSKGNGIDYMEFRLWIGLHSALQCLILVATDASFIIKYITRFTEEGFSTLISFIFIYDAIKKMIGAFKYYPINSDFKPDYVTMYKCECVAPDPANMTLFDASVPVAPNTTNVSLYNAINLTALDWTQLSKKECLKYGGSLVGKSCKFVPDLALMSFILFFGTYSMTLTLKKFKFSRYFPTKVRAFIADFSNVFSILLFCGVDACFGLDTPKLHIPSIIKLQVPTDFKPTRVDRGWFVFPFGKNPWWVYLASALPALLVTILIFMDQQITAVIVNRKEHKLRGAEGDGHHCLRAHRDFCLPGPDSEGVSCCLPWGKGRVFPCPQYIPMPVLYGVFLYMGVASLNGIQFWDRCKLFLMPAKHQPDYVFLRHVPLRRIHLFTLVQIVCLAVLWILKSTVAAIIFPVMILALILVRRLLDFVFSQHDLAWIDNIIPEKEKKKEDDKKKKKKGNKGDSSSDEEERGPPPGALRSDSSPNGSDMDRSITLHLKISCPSSPAFNYSRSPICAVPQVKIEMESDYEDTDTEKAPRDMGSETTL
ncbi:electrogenic sodium bicarbonate cotransporter 4 isoform X10 [Tympanuchus pallidicinctus]|uniref:electrogenic sodium bicarbonate cotransporter 4 isoform X10 n=1 Tax=Tympanuchus pallidicinctus TaxID=109042 RepID=UPI0022872814|nr:electrogenic sodium bicarbonate cotransporter 4 isoform X10 [Tympanuchus pallidicinctus]